MAAVLGSAKVSVFLQQDIKTFPKSSQWFFLTQTLINHKKHNKNRGKVHYLLLNRDKNKKHKENWVASQLALSFNAPS